MQEKTRFEQRRAEGREGGIISVWASCAGQPSSLAPASRGLLVSPFPATTHLHRRQRLKEAVAKGAGGQGAAAPAAGNVSEEHTHIWEREGQEAQMPPPGGWA